MARVRSHLRSLRVLQARQVHLTRSYSGRNKGTGLNAPYTLRTLDSRTHLNPHLEHGQNPNLSLGLVCCRHLQNVSSVRIHTADALENDYGMW